MKRALSLEPFLDTDVEVKDVPKVPTPTARLNRIRTVTSVSRNGSSMAIKNPMKQHKVPSPVEPVNEPSHIVQDTSRTLA